MAYISQYPPAQNSTYVKATSEISSSYYAYFATDPLLSLIGVASENAWLGGSYPASNQRFHIDLGSAKIITRLYYENFHTEGSATIRGVQNFTFWGSNSVSAFDELTYGTDTDWTQLTPFQSTFDQHVAANVADPKYITVTNTTAYRYYAIKCADCWGESAWLGFRRIELQSNDAVEIQKTILSDMKIVYTSQKTITSDMNINVPIQKTITSDMNIKVLNIQKNIFSDMSIAVIANFSFISNFVTKITKNKTVQTVLNTVLGKFDATFDTNFTTRFEIKNAVTTNLSTILVSYTAITPKNLNSIIVYKDGSELTDVDYSSLKIQLNLNSTPSNATFILARHHDDLDHNLLGATSIITARNTITVYDGTILLFTGYITKIDALSSSDIVQVTAEDKRCIINETNVSFYYGGYSSAQTVESAISYVLGISGLSGSLSVSLVPEPTYFNGNCGAALDELIGNSINANWYLDANENFQVQKVASGPIKTLSLSNPNSRRHIYDTILNDVILNKITNNYTLCLKVKMGKQVVRSWANWSALSRNYYFMKNPITLELTMTAKVQADIVNDLNYIKNVKLNGKKEPQIFAIQNDEYTGNTVCLDEHFINIGNFSGSPLVGVTYMGQYKWYDSESDLPYAIVGSGNPQRELILSQFGCKWGNGQLVTEEIGSETWLGYQYEESYDYRPYALDLANYELSQNNKPLTEASITLILDAYEYYGLNLSDLINLSNTTAVNIYNNTNGFPLNIAGVTIDCATRIVSINATNYGKTFYQRTGDYQHSYYGPMFFGHWRAYVPAE